MLETTEKLRWLEKLAAKDDEISKMIDASIAQIEAEKRRQKEAPVQISMFD